MAFGQFFNLQEKNVDNNIKIIIDEIIKAYNIGNRTYKTDKKDVIVPKVGYSEAMQALQKIRLYKK